MDIQYTCFGRSYTALKTLEEILQKERFEKHEALLIGPGLSDFVAPFKHEPELLGLYSWEPFEVAVILKRLGKPWMLTVADRSEYILNAVQNQTGLPVYFERSDGSRERIAYAESLLAQMQAMGAGINTRFNHSPEVYIGVAEIPQEIRSRIELAKRDLSKPEQWKEMRGKFNIVVCHYVLDAAFNSEMNVLPALLAPNGILSFGGCHPFPSLRAIQKNPLGFYKKKQNVHTAEDAKAAVK